ncbi:hypothetical protein M378DRAFT_620110 [Amanita muscaria Koide BX008]|uniref:Uncharacterized protein n=1 Tax=Amanita muscaria (strain Koide BX008) TaxID=946122 RepID=A0A0C2XLH4_AMAMK|nr:hypothetical protein M378DRAFT_620110 [Amanita muscaria Koide BX008]
MSLERMNLNSLDDYQANLAQIERARQVLDAYQTMNEDAKNKFEYQQELARKIAEGDRARCFCYYCIGISLTFFAGRSWKC